MLASSKVHQRSPLIISRSMALQRVLRCPSSPCVAVAASILRCISGDFGDPVGQNTSGHRRHCVRRRAGAGGRQHGRAKQFRRLRRENPSADRGDGRGRTPCARETARGARSLRLQGRHVPQSLPAQRAVRRWVGACRRHGIVPAAGKGGGAEGTRWRGVARRAGRSGQGAWHGDCRGRRLRLALAIRDRGALALSDPDHAVVLDDDAARQEPGHPHAVGPAFRAPPRRHSHHRSRPASAVRARNGRAAEEIHHGGSQALSVGVAAAFHRMLGQRLDRMAQAHAQDRAGHPRPAQHFGMDRRPIRDAGARSRIEGGRGLGARRGRGFRGDDAQHSAGEAAHRRDPRLRAERRGAAPPSRAIRCV
jgi:hypothetical protein